MVRHNISRVMVIAVENKPTGIITEADILNFLLADKTRCGIEEIKAEEVISKNLITTKPTTYACTENLWQ